MKKTSLMSVKSDASSTKSTKSRMKIDESLLLIPDLLKLIHYKFPELNADTQNKIVEDLNLYEGSEISINRLRQKLDLKIETQEENRETFVQLRDLFESPMDKGLRIIKQVRESMKDNMKSELDWLENTVFENAFDMYNKELLNISRELQLSFTKNDTFVDEFIKVKNIEINGENGNLRHELASSKLNVSDEFTPLGYRRRGSLSTFADKSSSVILEDAKNPNFNVFAHSTDEINVLVLAFAELVKTKFADMVDLMKATDFVVQIAEGYEEYFNPYHNSTHAADVMLSIYQYGVHFNINKFLFRQEQLAIYFAAVIHDYKHMGFNNNFYIRLEKDIALRYNNVSPLENYHLYEAFKLIRTNRNLNIFSNFSETSYLHIKEVAIMAVLSTDVRNHNSVLDKAKRSFCVDRDELLESKLKKINIENVEEKPDVVKERLTDMQDLVNLIIHCADISNPTKKFPVYTKWVDLVFKEFRNQGRKEISLNLSPSFLCEPNVNIPKAQLGFMSGFVKPTFLLLCKILPELDYLVKQMDKNIEEFSKKVKEQEEKK